MSWKQNAVNKNTKYLEEEFTVASECLQRAWIGLHEDVNSWRWSMSDQYQNQFRNWAAGQPNNKFGRESCGALSADGSWYDVSCSQTLHTVCFNVCGKDSSDTQRTDSSSVFLSDSNRSTGFLVRLLWSVFRNKSYVLLQQHQTELDWSSELLQRTLQRPGQRETPVWQQGDPGFGPESGLDGSVPRLLEVGGWRELLLQELEPRRTQSQREGGMRCC